MSQEEFREIAEKLKNTSSCGLPVTDQALAQEEEWAREASRIGLPARLISASFQTALKSEAIKAAEASEESWSRGKCLVLSGPTGCGKSWASACVLRRLQGCAVNRAYFYVPDLCSALYCPERRVAALESAKRTRFVVFDDLGTEYLKLGGFIDAYWDAIFWWREGNFMPTIVNTNLTPEEIKARLSERIRDRLNGDWGKIVVVKGPSLRHR